MKQERDYIIDIFIAFDKISKGRKKIKIGMDRKTLILEMRER